MGFSRQECWSGLPCPSPGDLPDPGIEPRPASLQADSLPQSQQGSPCGSARYAKFQRWPFSSVQFSCSVTSDSLQPHGLQHARLPCPSPIPRNCSNSCPSSRWCHPIILSSDVSFSSRLQSFPASESFPESQFFTSGGQSIEASASVFPVNIHDWLPLGLTVLISLQSRGLSWWSLLHD